MIASIIRYIVRKIDRSVRSIYGFRYYILGVLLFVFVVFFVVPKYHLAQDKGKNTPKFGPIRYTYEPLFIGYSRTDTASKKGVSNTSTATLSTILSGALSPAVQLSNIKESVTNTGNTNSGSQDEKPDSTKADSVRDKIACIKIATLYREYATFVDRTDDEDLLPFSSLFSTVKNDFTESGSGANETFRSIEEEYLDLSGSLQLSSTSKRKPRPIDIEVQKTVMKDGYCDILFVEKRKEPSDPKRNYRVEKISTSTPGIINAFYKKLSEAVDSQYKIHRDKIFEEREKRSLGIETK